MKISNPFDSFAGWQAGAAEPRTRDASAARSVPRSLGGLLGLRRRDASTQGRRTPDPAVGSRGRLSDVIGLTPPTAEPSAWPGATAPPPAQAASGATPSGPPTPSFFRTGTLVSIPEDAVVTDFEPQRKLLGLHVEDEPAGHDSIEAAAPAVSPGAGRPTLTRQKAVREHAPGEDLATNREDRSGSSEVSETAIGPTAGRPMLTRQKAVREQTSAGNRAVELLPGWPLLKPSIARRLDAVSTSAPDASAPGPSAADLGSRPARPTGSAHDAWSAAAFPAAKATMDRLRGSASARPAARVDRLNDHLAPSGRRLNAHALVSAEGTHVTLAPARASVDRELSHDTMIELSPDRLSDALAIKHPDVATVMPELASRTRVISPETAARLASAREVIDLVKALMPAGAGNQVKDLAASEGESALRSSLAYALGSTSARAAGGILWKGGYCDAQASLAYTLLAQNPDLAAAQIDLVDGGKDSQHVFAVIRGRTRERDIVVDPWATFATPTLAKDALKMHRQALRVNGGVRQSKPAGTVAPTLNVEGAVAHGALLAGASTLAERFMAEKARRPEEQIASTLSGRDRWDVPFSGNPNVRYEVRDSKGRRLTEHPLRFDVQRVRAAAPSASEGPLYVPRAMRQPVDAPLWRPAPRATTAATAAPTATAMTSFRRLPEELWPRFDDKNPAAADKPAA